MQPWRVLFPVDFSPETRHVVPVVAHLADILQGRVTARSVEGKAATGDPGRVQDRRVERLRNWLGRELAGNGVSALVREGLPGVEISRQAEEDRSDLVVMVQKPRSEMARELIGDTVDAVIRRATTPCLVFHQCLGTPRGVLVALDGTERGLAVLAVGGKLAERAGWPMAAVTVEPRRPGEPDSLAAMLPSTRTLQLSRRLTEQGHTAPVAEPVIERRGDVVEELLAEMALRDGWLLVLGYRRGGPPGILEAGSIARSVVHQAVGPVLTVPL